MKQGKIFLPVVFLAGTCIAVAPAWSQTSPSPAEKSSRERTQAGEGLQAPGQAGETQQGQTGGSRARGGMAAGGSSSMGHQAGGHANVKKVQEALKEKGHDPGPIDGVMGPKTQEALRAFQQSNNLKATGRIDAETAQKLGIDQGTGSAAGQRSGGKSGSSAEQGTSGMSGQGSDQGSSTNR
jgi:peptidoglycan hydrolase-like protein with peptidoglycan-binding domain